jgi:hypothetical protein
MLPATTQRVSRNTAPRVNDQIRKDTERHVARFDRADPKEIRPRLLELNREWDIERFLETNASVAVLTGIALGVMVDRRFFAIPAIVAGFLLQHAVSGWCPPIPILRRLGFRTQFEIEQERYALKALRGDFAGSTPYEGQPGRTQPILDAVRRS